jgi:hypothetical protein
MTETVTIELPEQVVRSAKLVADQTHRRLEEVLVEWLDRVASDLPVEMLPDDQILALCDLQMPGDQQEQLNDLLIHNREGKLGTADQERLDQLMLIYRRGMVRKAQALKVAVERRLRPALG